MNAFKYLSLLFFLGSCISAQHFDLVNISRTVNFGGVKGARSETFEIAVKENPSLQPAYLLVGKVKIDLAQQKKNGIIYLKGTFYPEKTETVSEDGSTIPPANATDYDLNNAVLVSIDIKSKQEVSQKINFSNENRNDDSLPVGDVPQ